MRVNADLRPSRLVKSIPRYIQRSVFTMIRIFVVYRPFQFFVSFGLFFFLVGFLLGLRFLVYYLGGHGQGMTQSLILAAVLMIIGAFFGLMAFMADLLSVNRMLLEDIQYQQRKQRCNGETGNDRADRNLSEDLDVPGCFNLSEDFDVSGCFNLSEDFDVSGGFNIPEDLNLFGGFSISEDFNVSGGIQFGV
ncbi:hypothetical protein SDC9_147577 [bioreactor metagenome]|uniref:Glycosyltransferase 2-like domain-containing protein n=1 Tax=bioreactor metagenome TaxID=1076179 RepID=A0A645EIH2_9ZZZZ